MQLTACTMHCAVKLAERARLKMYRQVRPRLRAGHVRVHNVQLVSSSHSEQVSRVADSLIAWVNINVVRFLSTKTVYI